MMILSGGFVLVGESDGMRRVRWTRGGSRKESVLLPVGAIRHIADYSILTGHLFIHILVLLLRNYRY